MKLPDKYQPIEKQPDSVEIKMVEGLFVKSMLVHKAGTWIPQHGHETTHLSMLAVGRVRAWAAGKCLGEFTAPAGIEISARVLHTFETLTDGVLIYCIHRTEIGQGVQVVEQHQFAFSSETGG